MDFAIAPEVKELLELIKEAKLDWIADEVQEELEMGRTFEKKVMEPGQKKISELYQTVPFNNKDQLRMAVQAIQRYTHDLYNIWAVISDANGKMDIKTPIKISVLDEEGKTPMVPFQKDILESLVTLQLLLNRLISETEKSDSHELGGGHREWKTL